MTTIIGGALLLLPALVGMTVLSFLHRPILFSALFAR
jgi:hypothetical protein